MRPRALIAELDLLRPIYRATSAYGHFGRSEFSWEGTDRAEEIASDLLGVQPKAKRASATRSSGAPRANGAANGARKLNGLSAKKAKSGATRSERA